MNLPRIRGYLLTAVVVSMAVSVQPQSADSGVSTGLSAEQIVDRMQSRDREQARALRFYKALRHYEVKYHGFSSDVVAKMDVEVDYDATSGKNLVIVSQSGSKFLLERVLKRAVDSEREAFQKKESMALTRANYRFELMGREVLAGRSAYVLDVEPLVASKFLYRGRIWVDGVDFAVVKMETEPARSPSFWISRTQIHYVGTKTDGFWMPQAMRSETTVRLGGVAELTIDYGNYQIAPGRLVSGSRAPGSPVSGPPGPGAAPGAQAILWH